MASSFCRRFRWAFSLDMKDPWAFVESEYLQQWTLWLTRTAMVLTCIGTLLYTSIEAPVMVFWCNNSSWNVSIDDTPETVLKSIRGQFFLAYLTIWSYILIMVYFLTALFNMAVMLRKSRYDILSKTVMRCLMVQWILCGVACNAALVVSAVFWAVLYPNMSGRCHSNMRGPLDILVHACNLLFVLLEVVSSSVVIRPAHFFYTVGYGLVYEIFSALYWIPDHSRVMYPVILDWNHPVVPVLVFLALVIVGLPIVNAIWWSVCEFRTWLVRRCHRTDNAFSYQPVNSYES